MPDRIDEETDELKYHQLVFQVGTQDDRMIRGFVISDDPRITPEKREFEGSSVTVLVRVDLTGLARGDSVSGSLFFVTSIGEKVVPVYLELSEDAVESAYGELRSLDDFAALVQRDVSSAFRAFTQPSFPAILTKEKREIRTLCRGLSANPVTLQRMEEFLVAAGKKDPVSYSLDSEKSTWYDLKDSVKDVLRIRRSGWGLAPLTVRTEGAFLTVSGRELVEEDFVASVCSLEYVIHADRLPDGRNFGKIILTAPGQTLTYTVVASKGPEVRTDDSLVRQRNLAKLVGYAAGYLSRRLDKGAFCERTLTLLAAIRNMGAYPVGCLLYEAYVLTLQERVQDARLLLRSLQDHNFTDDPPEYKAAFLYLCHAAELLPPDRIDVVEKIRGWHMRSKESVVLLGLRFLVDDDLKRSGARRLSLMEDLFGRGCISPLLFAEASALLRDDPTCLIRLTPFTRRTLRWMARRQLLTGELAERCAILAGGERSFTKEMYCVLAACYEESPSDAVLASMCRFLMKGEAGNAQYFRWYALGVEREIRLTRLYESYIETMPENYQKELPPAIRKYFSLSDSLSDSKKAMIYANIVRNRVKDPATYEVYEEQMRGFASEMLGDGKINENYAVLYQHFLSDVRSEEIGRRMAEILFTERLFCDDPNVREVVVIHPELKGESVYPIRQGVAYIDRYTKDAQILFQDEQYRRFCGSVAYQLEPLMEKGQIAERCSAMKIAGSGFDLYQVRGDGNDRPADASSIEIYRRIAESPDFTEEFRRDVRRRILEFCAQNAANDSLDRFLEKLDYVEYAKVNRKLLIEVMISRGFFEEAFDLLNRYGYENIDPGLLMRLVSVLIGTRDGERHGRVLLLAAAVFRKGKYDERTLTYLVEYYYGLLCELLAIRSAARDFFLDTYAIDERILMQAMFVRNYPDEEGEILGDYLQQGGKQEVLRADLIHRANGYFLGRCSLTAVHASRIRKEIEENRPLDRVCDLALLKYYSEKEALSGENMQVADSLMRDCIREGLRFSFFLDLPQPLRVKYQLEDRVFVEQEAEPGDRVTLHYRMTGGNAPSSFRSAPLKQMYRRIFSREFLLFTGEVLTYYVEIEHDGKLTRLPEKTLTMSAARMQGRSRYQLINQMRSAQRLGKEDVLKSKIAEYCAAENVVRTLFHLEDPQEGGMSGE